MLVFFINLIIRLSAFPDSVNGLTIASHTIANMSMDQKNQGKPKVIAFPHVDPLPIWPLTVGIFKSAPHPNAAKLFLTWHSRARSGAGRRARTCGRRLGGSRFSPTK